MPKHHPSEALLVAYAAGSLGEGLSLVLATHLQLCPECRARVRAFDAVGGALLDAVAPDAVAPDALARTLALIDAEPAPGRPVPPAAPPPAGSGGLMLPAPLGRVVGPIGERSWKRLAPGIRQIEVATGDAGGGSVRLLRIAPGRVMPHHGHSGTELTLIFSGSYSDELGRYTAGDLGETDGEVEHQPISDGDEDCVCVIATDGPLRFTGLFPRLMQPFFRI